MMETWDPNTHSFIPFGAESTVFMPYEVGDYSIYLHENLEGIKKVRIYIDGTGFYDTKEIIASPEGSILYFEDKIEGIEAGFIYRGWTLEDQALKWHVYRQKIKAGNMSIDAYLKRLKGI